MNETELIEILQDSLLWEAVSAYIEESPQVNEILKEADINIRIENVTIQDSEFFEASVENATNTEIIAEFKMPFIILINMKYSIEAYASGKISIPALFCYNYNDFDFENMNKKDLLSHKDIVRITELNFADIELISEAG